MTFTVHTNLNEAFAEQLAQAATKAEHAVALQAQKDTSPYVPFRNGVLDRETKVVGNTIIYRGPYARFLYYGKVMIYPPTGSTFAPAGERKVVTDRNLVFTKDFHPDAQAFWFEASKAQNMDKWQRVAQKAVEKYGRE